jgi:uncharacterized protein
MSRLAAFAVFFGVALLLMGAMHWYLWIRLVRDPQLPTWATRALTAALIALGASMMAAFALARLSQGTVARSLVFLAFFWMGAGFLAFALLGLSDVARLAGGAALWVHARIADVPDAPADPARRVFFSRALAAATGGTAAVLSAWGVRSAMGAIDVRELTVRIKNLPEQLAGFRLVQISDVHIGALLRKDWLEGVVQRVRSLSPHAVAITGDLVDGSVADLRDHVAPLAALADAPHGAWFCTGNHEYYSGVEQWAAHLPTLGIRPLRNERAELAPGLDIAGVDDWSAGRFGEAQGPDLKKALAGRDAEKPLVLLAHQPRQWTDAARENVSLTLSGHTHGGQIWPFSWLVFLVQPWVAGLHRQGDAQLYVSRGTGFWGPPLRVFAPAEITLLRLVPA